MVRVILLGGTGYTGGLLLRELIKKDIRPVLLGRNPNKLEALAKQYAGLEWIKTDLQNLEELKQQINKGDLLISTVGPFDKFGRIPLQAAVEQGANYMDCTGEPNFISDVYHLDNQKLETSKTVVMTACGYDYVPGQLVGGALADKFGEKAIKLNIGYAVDEGKIARLSPGTVASLLKALFEKGIFFKNGKFYESFLGKETWPIVTAERTVKGISVPALECQELPKTYSQLQDVNVYLAWFGAFGGVVSGFNRFQHVLFNIPGYLWLMRKLSNFLTLKFVGQKNEDLDANRSLIVGEVLNQSGEIIGSASLRGHNAYIYTTQIMAWMASQIVAENVRNYGVVGPIRAFGLESLLKAHKDIGYKFTLSENQLNK